MLSQLLEDHCKLQKQLQQRRSSRRPLSCDAVIRECLKWNKEFPDVKVEFKILFPENFKAEGIKPMDEMCFIRELAQNQENPPLQYPKVTPEQLKIFMEKNPHLDNQRAVWRLEEELYEKKLGVVCDTLMKKLLEWNRNNKTENIKFWIQTPLFWTHPDIKDTNGKYVQVVDLSERKLSPEEMERQFHIRFNTRIRDLDFQEFALQSEMDLDGNIVPNTELQEVYDNMFGQAVNMKPQRRIRTRFMFAHVKHLSESPEEYKFDKSGEQLVMKSPKEMEAVIIRCEKEKEFRDKYMHLYYLEQQAVRSHPMAPAFKVNSIALKFIRRKYMEEFGELFFPEERYKQFLMKGSPNIRPHERPTKVACIILSQFDNRKFRSSSNIGNFEMFPVISEIPGKSSNKNTTWREHLPVQYSKENKLPHKPELNNAAGDTSNVHNLAYEPNFDQTARLEETITKTGNAEDEKKSEKQKPSKNHKTRSLQMWKETKQRKLVVIGKRRYSVKRQKNMKKLIVDQGKAIGLQKENRHENTYNVTNRSRGEFKDTHLCKERRSVSHESVFDLHGSHQHSREPLMYPCPRITRDDIILVRAKIMTECTKKSEVFDQSLELPDDDIEMNYDLVTSKGQTDITITDETNSSSETERIALKDVTKLTPTSMYSQSVEEDKNKNEQHKPFENIITEKVQNTPILSSIVKKASDLQLPNVERDFYEDRLQCTREQLSNQQFKKNVAFDIFDEPKKPISKPKLSSNKKSSSDCNDKVKTDEETSNINAGSNQAKELNEKPVRKNTAFDIFDEPRKPRPKPKLSSARRPTSGIKHLKEESQNQQQVKVEHTKGSGTKHLKEKSQNQQQTKGEHNEENNQGAVCREKIDGDVEFECQRRTRSRTRWPSRLSPIDEQGNGQSDWPVKKSEATTLSRAIRRIRFRSTPRGYKYSRLHNTSSNPSRIPVCLRQDLSTNRNHKVIKNLNVVKSKFRYSRLHRMSQVATLLPDLWTKSEEMMMKLKSRNIQRQQKDHCREHRSPSRLGRPKQRQIPTKTRKRSMIPVRIKTANVHADNKNNRRGKGKCRSRIPIRIEGYIWNSSDTDTVKENVNRYKLKASLRKSRIPVPINGKQVIERNEPKENESFETLKGSNNKMTLRLPPIVQKSKPSGSKSPNKLKALPAHLPPLPNFPDVSFRRSPPLLGKIPSTTSRPASVTGYCVLPPIGKSSDKQRPLSAGANRKFLPPIEQMLIRPLSASGYAKLPPIPRSE